MRFLFCLCLVTNFTMNSMAQDKDTKPMFELRMYTVAEDKLSDVTAFFEKFGNSLYPKYDIKPLAYFISTDPNQQKFLALLQHKDRTSRDENIAKVRNDDLFKEAFAELTKDGNPIKKAEEFFLYETDYSMPPNVPENTGKVFELRTYTTTPNNLKALDARFRDHTRNLFAKYDMTNLWYFHLTPESTGSENTLIYFLSHKDNKSRNESFNKFRVDPDWITVRDASEKSAGGSLTTPDGVQSLMLKATSFSPLK